MCFISLLGEKEIQFYEYIQKTHNLKDTEKQKVLNERVCQPKRPKPQYGSRQRNILEYFS